MPRYTMSAHFLIKRLVVFIHDSKPPAIEETWMWIMLKASTPVEICDVLDPAVLLQWAEHAGHAETKFECQEQAVKML